MRLWQRGSKAGLPKCRTGLIVCKIVPPNAGGLPRMMIELDIKKITRLIYSLDPPGMPLVLDESVPSIYWQPCPSSTQGFLSELKDGTDIKGVTLSNPEPVLSVRTR